MKRYKTRARRRELVRASLHKRRQKLIADGICRDCGKAPVELDRTLCRYCLDTRLVSRENTGRVERMLALAGF